MLKPIARVLLLLGLPTVLIAASWRESHESRPTLKSGPVLSFEPRRVLLGDSSRVRVEGLEPDQEALVRLVLVDEWKRTWVSEATFVADSAGTIDLNQVAPIAGAYGGVDPAGLFWSAQLQSDGQVPAGAIPQTTSEAVLQVLLNGQPVASATQTRVHVASELAITQVRDSGLVAQLFLPPEPGDRPAVVLMGGSGGGMVWASGFAGLLASRGYPALALAYFNAPALPNQLDRIPVEYVENALEYLKKQLPDGRHFVLIGYSKGAEYALVSASLLPEVDGLIAFAPSHVAFQSIAPPQWPRNSGWTYAEQEVPFVSTYLPRGVREPESSIERWHIVLHASDAVAEAEIPVERLGGPVLLLSGKADEIWPSAYMADRLALRLSEAEFEHEVTNLAYPGAGHAIARPGFEPTTRAQSLGGDPKRISDARHDAWHQVLGFLERLHSSEP